MSDDLDGPEAEPLKTGKLYPLWIAFGVVSCAFGLVLFITMSMMLEAQREICCPLLKIIGGVLLPLGLGIVAAGILALKKLSLQMDSTSSACARYTIVIVSFLIYVILIFAVVVAVAVFRMSKSVPSATAYFKKVAGISGDVTITRTSDGVVHIVASSREDALFGQGFVHAQDRLFQLELFRLAYQGRLAEFFGSEALDIDKTIHTIGIPQKAKVLCSAINPSTASSMSHYVQGINTFLDKEGARPPEFLFFGTPLIQHEPDPFSVDDVCGAGALLQWQLSEAGKDNEIERWKLFEEGVMGYSEVLDLYEDFVNSSSVLSWRDMGFSEADAVASRAREAATKQIERDSYDALMSRFRRNSTLFEQPSRRRLRKESLSFKARVAMNLRHSLLSAPREMSNQWVARQGGKPPILCTDPHLNADLPSAWHYVHLKYGSHNVAGVTVPFLPGVAVGRTTHVSWGVTNSFADRIDFLLMDPDPNNPQTHYMYHGESLPYSQRIVTIKVKGEDDARLVVWETVLGPVVDDIYDMYSNTRVVLNSTLLLPDTTSVDAMLALSDPDRTKTVDDMHTLAQQIMSPFFQISMADSSGSIGFVMTGKYPIRVPGHTGRVALIGNGSFDILGYVPMSELPAAFDKNVSQDRYWTVANQREYPDGYPYSLVLEPATRWRSGRLEELFEAASPADLSDPAFHKRVQFDLQCNVWTKVLRPAIQSLGTAFTSKLSTPGVVQLDQLLSWDNTSSIGSQEAAFLWQWLFEIGTLPSKAMQVMELRTWDVKTYPSRIFTPSVHMQAYCSERTGGGTCLDFAADKWNEIAAATPKKWGIDIHRLQLRHIIFTGTILECIFDRESDCPGDSTTLAIAEVWHSLMFDEIDRSFPVRHTVSSRQVFDWADSHRNWFVFPGGESGNPWSDFYINFLEPWKHGQHHEVRWDSFAGDAQQLRP